MRSHYLICPGLTLLPFDRSLFSIVHTRTADVLIPGVRPEAARATLAALSGLDIDWRQDEEEIRHQYYRLPCELRDWITKLINDKKGVEFHL